MKEILVNKCDNCPFLSIHEDFGKYIAICSLIEYGQKTIEEILSEEGIIWEGYDFQDLEKVPAPSICPLRQEEVNIKLEV